MNRYETFSSDDNSGSEDEEEVVPTIVPSTQERSNTLQLSRIFQLNETEQLNNCVLFQVRRTVRERIFPFLKFCNETVLRMVKLDEKDNLLHLLLADLNRLDDDLNTRARFWLTYKNEIKNILIVRKTEVSNMMKVMVFDGKYIMILYSNFNNN